MAVQTAPLPPPHHHPFVPFGFPTGESCYGPDDVGGSGVDGGALLLLEGVGGANDAGGSGCPETSDFREATRDLLRFIDSASSNIKLALDKPGKSKRKVNHRKYLQKQIKRCTGLLGANAETAAAAATTPDPVPAAATAAASAAPANKPFSASSTPCSAGAAAAAAPSCKPPPAKRESKSLAALFDSCLRSTPFQSGGTPTAAVATPAVPASDGKDRAGSSQTAPGIACKKVPLRNRNLPRSFFTEPAPNRPPNHAGLEGPVPSVAEELFDLLAAPDYRALLQESTEPPPPPPSVFPAELPLEPSLYEPLPSLAPLLYAETPLRPLPALYAAVAAAAAVSDPTAPFFADCPLPPPPSMPYDYGYNRGVPYPSL
ncbi:protein FAM181B [Ahaetulla prasina]|uniref:protein FAM181B n=1 Tax=Ahaetulla prasina TaxID=499056 RepID=UPI0026482796|nr:protein FAM181B [Ahaetulla prasina]